MPVIAYAFDAYGTLFDVHSAIARHRDAVGPQADAFSLLWRQKHLEYTWTRTLMGRYVDFWTLAQQALDFCLARYPAVDPALKTPLLDAYRNLAAYQDVRPALTALRQAGHRLAIFTNGTEAMAQTAARSAGIADLFETIISVDSIGFFKTAPEVYGLVHQRLGLKRGAAALVSSNRWDVAGATAYGMPAVWANRTDQPDEYPDLPPVRTIRTLADLA
jgi:2-haloacid dehalogenase